MTNRSKLMRSRWIQLALSALFVAAVSLFAGGASATIIGSCPSDPTLACDDGAQLFVANANPNHGGAHIVLLKELVDPVPTTVPHTWGFFFASDPSTLITIFDQTDTPASSQQAVIDFDNGVVTDLDASTVQSTFTPSLADFGFYIDVPSLGIMRYSLNSLNPGGVDNFASFPTVANPLFRVVSFEINDQIFSFEIVDGGIPVPEPGTVALVALGLTGLAVRGRRRST